MSDDGNPLPQPIFYREPDPRDAEIAKLRSLLGEAADMLYKLGQHKLIEPPEEKLAKRIWQELGVEPKP